MTTWEILDPCSVASPDFLQSVVLSMVHRDKIAPSCLCPSVRVLPHVGYSSIAADTPPPPACC